jgi:hypothetical protein
VDITGTIQSALAELTVDSDFNIDRIDYAEKSFGNMYILLKSSKQVNIRFVKDRGTLFCSIGYANKWYFIEDVFYAIGRTFLNKNTEFTDYIATASSLIKSNIVQIFHAFNDEKLDTTLKKIEISSMKRVAERFENIRSNF